MTGGQPVDGPLSVAGIAHSVRAEGIERIAVVSDDWIGRGLKAGDLVHVASKATGSGGGGRPHLARGGVGDPEKVHKALDEALRHARQHAEAGTRL